MPVTVAADGTIYSGTWGMVRTLGQTDRRLWDKSDGKVFAHDRQLSPRWTSHLDRVPYCYSYGARAQTPEHCPEGGTVSWYNGTVEGVVTIDAARSRIYVGRGDGKLFAIDQHTGAIVWRFTTFNPLDPADPDGGGEVIAGPLVGDDGTIYIGTVAAGPYETNAVYAIHPSGALKWRYPPNAKSIDHVVFAAPALSPDGKTLYLAGAWGPTVDQWNQQLKGAVYAFHAATGALKWSFQPVNESAWWKPTVWTTELAVGTNGTIYAAGIEQTFGGGSSVLYALRDEGTRAAYAWPAMIDIDYNRAAVANGLALRESGGVTRRVYATSGNSFIELIGYRPGGKLVAVDAVSGQLLWRFDPEAHGGTGAMTGIAVDAEGIVYTGVSGKLDKGRVYAVREDGSLLWQMALGGLLEWAHPVIGPFGDLYVAETRRCLLNIAPYETGLCNSQNPHPRIYAIFNDAPARRRSARH